MRASLSLLRGMSFNIQFGFGVFRTLPYRTAGVRAAPRCAPAFAAVARDAAISRRARQTNARGNDYSNFRSGAGGGRRPVSKTGGVAFFHTAYATC